MELLESLWIIDKPSKPKKMQLKKLKQINLRPLNKTTSESKEERKPESKEKKIKSLKTSKIPLREISSSRVKSTKFLNLTFLTFMVTLSVQVSSELLVVS